MLLNDPPPRECQSDGNWMQGMDSEESFWGGSCSVTVAHSPQRKVLLSPKSS